MKKYWLSIASFLMIITGLLRGIGGISLLGENVPETDIPIMASPGEIAIAAYTLLIVCVLFIASGLSLTVRRRRINWILGWVSIVVFLAGGIINGFLLFGHPLSSGQLINFGISALIGACLFMGKDSIR